MFLEDKKKSKKDKAEKLSEAGQKRPRSEMESVLEAEEQRREAANRKDYWLHEGIVVKCTHKKLADGKYYNRKGLSCTWPV